MRTIFCFVLACAWVNSIAGSSAWTLLDTPTTASFNGVAIAVSNNGTIVHFVDGDSGTLVPSGTTEHLLDVYAVAARCTLSRHIAPAQATAGTET